MVRVDVLSIMSKQGSSRLTKSLCVLTYLKIHPNQSREKFNRRICLFCFFGSYVKALPTYAYSGR